MHPNFGTITSFLTDGSLAALCAAMSRLSGARVALVDPEGRSIALGEDDQPWHVRPPTEDSPTIARALREHGPSPFRLGERYAVLPLVVQGGPVGALLIDYAAPEDGGGGGVQVQRDLLEFAVEMLASTVSEFCEQAMEVNQRHSELRTLFRLSSLLVATRDIQTILQVAMRSAVEVFSMDACAVHLIEADSARETRGGSDDGSLTLRAHVGLPEAFTRAARTLPGSPHESPADRGRALIAQLAQEASFEGIVGVSLLFKDQPVGVLRLFSREQRLLSPSQHALLQTIAEQAAAAVCGARLVESERESANLRRQLELAGDVQHRMLPQRPPAFPHLDIAARYDPSFELSGDFYDLIELNGHLGVAVGDVSGKGIPAALLMAATRATLRAHSQDVFHLDELMGRVNKALARDTLPQEFVTVFYGVIDPKSLRLTYCNAGHDPPLVLQKPPKSGPNAGRWSLHELNVGGMVMGVDPDMVYERGMFDLSKGDVMVASTDGLTDAMNYQGEKFGRARLKQSMLDFMSANPNASASHIADHLLWDVRRFVGMNPQTDDITLVVIRAK